MDHNHHHLDHILQLPNIDPTDVFSMLAVMSSSLLLSIHCAAMCAPLVCASLGKRCHVKRSGIWLYNLGRVISYTFAGGILGLLSSSAGKVLPHRAPYISMSIGGLLAAAGILSFLKSNLFKSSGGKAFKLWPKINLPARLSHLTAPLQPRMRDLSLGLLSVFLPCMTLTPALAIAAGSQSLLTGALLMFSFAIGTVPIMILSTNVPLVGLKKLPQSFTQVLAALLLIVAGSLTIIKSLKL